MKGILVDIQMLAADHTIKAANHAIEAATQEQVRQLEEAIKDLSEAITRGEKSPTHNHYGPGSSGYQNTQHSGTQYIFGAINGTVNLGKKSALSKIRTHVLVSMQPSLSYSNFSCFRAHWETHRRRG